MVLVWISLVCNCNLNQTWMSVNGSSGFVGALQGSPLMRCINSKPWNFSKEKKSVRATLSQPWPYLPLFTRSRPVYAHPKLSEPSLSTQTFKPEPFGSIPSQLTSNTSLNPLTPLHLNNTFPTLYPFLTWPDAPSTCPLPRVSPIPDTHTHSWLDAIQPSFSSVKSTPDISLVLQLQLDKARSHTSLTWCVLVHFSSLSICLFPFCPLYVLYISSFATLLLFLCLVLSSPSPSTLVSSIFIPYLHWPYFSYSVFSLQPIPDRSDQPDPYHTPHLYKYSSYKLL